MTRVLLTGGNGFVASHILDILLKKGHSIVTTVRSQAKVAQIKNLYPKTPKSVLDFVIVENLANKSAFDEALVSDPPFEAIIHTASPFNFNITSTKKDLIDPAINGTVSILKAAHELAPTVKRIVITSSYASMMQTEPDMQAIPHTYSEQDWSPVTEEQAADSFYYGYIASKTFAEKAAWDFVETNRPSFTIVTICPPLVFGPILHPVLDLASLNVSNLRIREVLTGEWKARIPDAENPFWIDVRDLALGHVQAMEREEAGNQRFFFTAGYYSNKAIADTVREKFPNLADLLPDLNTPGGEDLKQELFKYDNRKTVEILGMKFTSLESSIVDLVNSVHGVIR